MTIYVLFLWKEKDVSMHVCMSVLVCIYMYMLGGKGKLTEPLRQVAHSSQHQLCKVSVLSQIQRQWFSSEL